MTKPGGMNQIKDFFQDPVAIKVTYLLVAFLIILLVGRFLKRILGRYISHSSTKYQASKLITFTSYGIFAIATMVIFNYKLSNLTLALGLAGAGIAFALQEIIVSIAGFIAILSANFYKTGDRIQMGGIKGDVVDIGVLRTTIMEIGDWVDGDLYNGKMVRVANSFLFKEPVFNYSGDFPFLWDEIRIPFKVTSDHVYFKELLTKILDEEVGQYARESQNSWDRLTDQLYVEKAQVSPMISLSFNENGAIYTLRYVVDFKKRRTTKDQLYVRILDGITQSEGKVEIAGASLEVTLENE